MASPSPELTELALRIVEEEAEGSTEPANAAAAIDAACCRLKNQLVDLLASGGASALVGRALHLAKREQPALAGVTASDEPDTCFSGVAESLAASSDEDASLAAAALLTHMLYLLVTLFGEEMAMKLVRKLWPQATRAREMDG